MLRARRHDLLRRGTQWQRYSRRSGVEAAAGPAFCYALRGVQRGEDSMNPRHRNPPGVDIGLRIAQYRRRRKWSQAKLALRAGMPRPYVGKVEMGLTIPNPKQVLRFSEALNVGIELLIEPS